jgi:hypothetical protein
MKSKKKKIKIRMPTVKGTIKHVNKVRQAKSDKTERKKKYKTQPEED